MTIETFDVGDIVFSNNSYEHYNIKKGDKGVIVATMPWSAVNVRFLDGPRADFHTDNLYKEVQTNKFKVGDTVKVVRKYRSSASVTYFGKVGTVIKTHGHDVCTLDLEAEGGTSGFWSDELEKVDVFKVGDKFNNDGEIYFKDTKTGTTSIIWVRQFNQFIKLGGTMTKYEELKRDIEGLENGWDKDADDVLQELNVSKDKFYTIEIEIRNDHSIVGYLDLKHNNLVAQRFEFHNQCEKMDAFRKALLHLLDHSNIKKTTEREDKILALES
ncbi:hypothetical protein LCGC14_3013110, partial [marine sediment metagenome]